MKFYKEFTADEELKKRLYSFRKIKKHLKSGKTMYSKDSEFYISKNRIACIFWNTSCNPDAEDFHEHILSNDIWKSFKCRLVCWDNKKCIGDCYQCKYCPASEKKKMERCQNCIEQDCENCNRRIKAK